MTRFATDLFGDAYDDDRGLVAFEASMGQLKDGVAAVTDELTERNPRVKFFAEQNPTWAEGTELVCVARMSWAMPFTYSWKVLTRKPRPKLPAREGPVEGRPAGGRA